MSLCMASLVNGQVLVRGSKSSMVVKYTLQLWCYSTEDMQSGRRGVMDGEVGNILSKACPECSREGMSGHRDLMD